MADFEIIDVSGCMNSWSAIGVEEDDLFFSFTLGCI